MKRIMIIGSGGAGKSTLARTLHHRLGLPLVHLDQHFWKPNWVEIDRTEWQTINRQLVAEENWIIDGNYGSTMEMRLERADTVIFLDYPTGIRLWRVWKRWWRYRGKARPDITEDCPETLTMEFLWYILRYRRTRTPGILQKLQALPAETHVYVLRSDQAVRDFLTSLNP